MQITVALSLLTACFFSVPGNAVSTPPTSPNPAAREFQGHDFLSALPAGKFGSVGRTVTPNGEILQVPDLRRSSDEPQLELRISMGTQRQHVGFTKSRDLGGELRTILKKLCGLQDLSPDDHAERPANAAVPGSMCSGSSSLSIKRICYSAGCEAYVGVQVPSDHIPSQGQDAKDLLNSFIEQIVNTFEATINCDKNRYVIDETKDRMPPKGATKEKNCREFANSADWYQVGIHGMPNDIYPHMRVKIWSNGKTDEGQFDCKGTQTCVWQVLPDSRIHEFAKMVGAPLRAAVSCADEHGISEGWATGTEGCQWDPNAIYRCGHDPECGLT